MVHGDDSGLVLPPRIAPVQTMIIPIAQHKEGVLEKANELLDTLKTAGYKVKIDDSDKALDGNSVSRKCLVSRHVSRSDQRISRQNQAVIVRRDTREKIVVSLDEIRDKTWRDLETIQKDMFERQKHSLTATLILLTPWMK